MENNLCTIEINITGEFDEVVKLDNQFKKEYWVHSGGSVSKATEECFDDLIKAALEVNVTGTSLTAKEFSYIDKYEKWRRKIIKALD